MLSPKALEKDLLQASLLASGGCWQSLAFLGLWQHNFSLCVPLHMAFPSVCVSVFKFPFSLKMLVIGLGSTLLQCDLILT